MFRFTEDFFVREFLTGKNIPFFLNGDTVKQLCYLQMLVLSLSFFEHVTEMPVKPTLKKDLEELQKTSIPFSTYCNVLVYNIGCISM